MVGFHFRHADQDICPGDGLGDIKDREPRPPACVRDGDGIPVVQVNALDLFVKNAPERRIEDRKPRVAPMAGSLADNYFDRA